MTASLGAIRAAQVPSLPGVYPSLVKIAYLRKGRRPGEGANVLKRTSVNTLLKSVIAVLGAAVVVMLALNAWDSWQRLRVAGRIAAVAEVSGYLFTGLHNMRVDRASVFRDLQSDKPVTRPNELLAQSIRDEMPALNSALK